MVEKGSQRTGRHPEKVSQLIQERHFCTIVAAFSQGLTSKRQWTVQIRDHVVRGSGFTSKKDVVCIDSLATSMVRKHL